MAVSVAATCTNLSNVKKKKYFTNSHLVAINVSNQAANLPWHSVQERHKNTSSFILLHHKDFNGYQSACAPLQWLYIYIYMNIVTCGRTVGAQSRQLSCFWFLLLSYFPFRASHGSASPPSNAHHERNWPPQHSRSTKWSSRYHFHTVLHFTTNNTTFLSHYPYGPIKTRHFGLPLFRALDTPHCKHSTHTQALSRKYSDVRTAEVYDYRWSS